MKPTCWTSRGALMVDRSIDGVTQDLTEPRGYRDINELMRFYQGRYFVCETITDDAAQAIAKAMGWAWSDTHIDAVKPGHDC